MKPTRPVLFVALAVAVSLLGDQALYAILPTYYTELGLLPYQVGLLLSANRWIRLLTNQLAVLPAGDTAWGCSWPWLWGWGLYSRRCTVFFPLSQFCSVLACSGGYAGPSSARSV